MCVWTEVEDEPAIRIDQEPIIIFLVSAGKDSESSQYLPYDLPHPSCATYAFIHTYLCAEMPVSGIEPMIPWWID